MAKSPEYLTCPATFFVALMGIKLPLLSQPGLELGGGLRLLNDKAAIARMVNPYLARIGSLEHGYILNRASAVIWSNQKVEILQENPPESINGLVIQRLSEVQTFLMKLWLVKDNACDADTGWMNVKTPQGPIINNNRWSNSYCRYDGSSEPIEFSKRELVEAIGVALVPEDAAIGRSVPLYRTGISDSSLTKLSHGSLRVQRFLYFVNGARTSRDVAIKVAEYCSGLEALVSSSHSELTHQVAERVAVLLRPNGRERLDMFQRIKAAYGLRSKAVHGASFKDRDHGKLVASAADLDQICREATLAYLGSPELESAMEADDSAFSGFWMEKLFL